MGSPVAPLTSSVVGTEAGLGAEWPRLSSDFWSFLCVSSVEQPRQDLVSARRS